MSTHPESRSAELRQRHRRVSRWSLGIAVLLHVLVFMFWPGLRVESPDVSDPESRVGEPAQGRPTYVEATFGPPDIFEADGTLSRQDRELEADHILLLPPGCVVLSEDARPPAGRVRLRVWKSGRTDVVELAESTGSECGDEVITALADALWYRWLPNERYPAPVDLIQPVTLMRAEN
jgi:hypothetical protein